MISTEYHTDDFYQRMLDLGDKAMRAAFWNSGDCKGGPCDGKTMHHPSIYFRLAVDQNSKKAIPGMVASSDPDIKFGTYRFADGVWTWDE